MYDVELYSPKFRKSLSKYLNNKFRRSGNPYSSEQLLHMFGSVTRVRVLGVKWDALLNRSYVQIHFRFSKPANDRSQRGNEILRKLLSEGHLSEYPGVTIVMARVEYESIVTLVVNNSEEFITAVHAHNSLTENGELFE